MVIPCNSRREQVLKLIEQKDKIEKTINDCGRILVTNKNVGLHESLVDAEGFPRNDIDVYQVRQARHQIVCLQNDLKALMKEIEQGLIEIHADAKVNLEASTKISRMVTSSSDSTPENETPAVAFAKINLVSDGSPAEEAGIRKDDTIIEFGSLNATNFKEITQIAEIVKHRENQPIQLKIQRADKTHELTLVPKQWSGRGLLGCNIVLADPVER